jgi:hypothetical protein
MAPAFGLMRGYATNCRTATSTGTGRARLPPGRSQRSSIRSGIESVSIIVATVPRRHGSSTRMGASSRSRTLMIMMERAWFR